jgi:hypothetical protein
MTRSEAANGSEPRSTNTSAAPLSHPSRPRKLMVRPQLTRHGSLPQVTGGFIGGFTP